MTKAGIYIHIPFCTNKCIYCDYYSIEKREKDMPHFIDMLIREIELTSQDYHEDWTFDSIFFGGGTPSIMNIKWLRMILNTLKTSFDISKVKEITLESNPGETSKQQLSQLRKLGINRLSIGFQSLQPELLTILSRIHNPKDCLNTYKNARDAGFDNINVDMLFNIPGQDFKVWQKDLGKVLNLAPDHISAYSLIVEKNTPLHSLVKNGQIIMPSEKMNLTMFEFVRKYLSSHGYNQYEISNYTIDGMKCLHNLHYWNLDPYLAFGPSAHGYDGHNRWWNISSLDAYIRKLEQKKMPLSGSETLSQIDHFNEAVFNGLRTREGIQLRNIHSWETDVNKMNLTILKWKDRLDITKDTIFLKYDSYQYADEIASDMMITETQ